MGEVGIKLGCQRVVTAQLRKLPINSPNHLNIIVFDKLQILLLILLAINRKLGIDLLVQLTLLVLLPMIQLEVVDIFVAE